MLFKDYRKNCWQMVGDSLLKHKIEEFSSETLKKHEGKEGTICRRSAADFFQSEDLCSDAQAVQCKVDRLSCLPGMPEGFCCTLTSP